MTIKPNLAGAVLAVAVAFAGAASAEDFITVGTGGVTGVYYPAGGAICRLVNKERSEHRIRCSIESTGGSVYNIRAIRRGDLEFGVVQSDVQAAALEGTGAFAADRSYSGLRALFSIYPEPLHVVARKDAGIDSAQDLKGKKVNIGNPGSGSRVMAEILLLQAGISPEDLALAGELKSTEQAAALCEGKLDAAIWAAGLPNASALEATSTCDIRIIPLDGEITGKVLAETSAYAAATIPGGLYPGNPNDIPSWGPRATFVTSADVPDQFVYAVVSAVFENFDEFKALHPAFALLKREEMIKDGLTADLHPGAVKYYQEQGWL
ncbi:TAXI family TRAP transporter solute-binding subunit [Roseibium salinum]|uniref:TAXI family TRAP transporter solute-binding subunit n=1 Tax=Roseibium salinum TaxID=1604349 RepID=A0ABT3R293_9HYPH|nr:TAXI family TRAP transporter solute-binding subunit [Roseibium sp. DSM 29163]MCX2723369.1 TAXI family TRAP transporter solute-binding subunit [Roseibium sp. DSM 29163]